MEIKYRERVVNYLLNQLEEGEVYVMLAIARKKYNKNIKSAIVFREVVDRDNFEQKFQKMSALLVGMESFGIPASAFNIYITFNPRSLVKGFRLIRNVFTDWVYEYVVNKDFSLFNSRLSRLDRYFISVLQKPESVSRRLHFLVDIDDKSRLELVKGFLSDKTEVLFEVETVNGYHLLVRLFNLKLWLGFDDVELKKRRFDLYLSWVDRLRGEES